MAFHTFLSPFSALISLTAAILFEAPMALAEPPVTQSILVSNEKTREEIPLTGLAEMPSDGELQSVGLLKTIADRRVESQIPGLNPINATKEDEQSLDAEQYAEHPLDDSVPSLSDKNGEVVRERFEDGTLKVERHVALDAKGNYVNHGVYREWNSTGRVIVDGKFVMGNRDGHWMRVYDRSQADLFTAYPYADFESPYVSEGNFLSGHLHGVWKITDAKDLLVSEISFQGGFRDGPARWYHPTNHLMYETTYSSGVLDGTFIESSADGNVVKRETYSNGQRKEVNREYYPNKQVKLEYQSISALQSLKLADDWWLCKPAQYELQGEPVKEGPFTAWYENGQMKSRGSYVGNQLQGRFESWHPNNQKESSGDYMSGSQQGTWTSWHANGMKKSVGNYEAGRIIGTWSAWHPDGKVVETKISQPLESSQAKRRMVDANRKR